MQPEQWRHLFGLLASSDVRPLLPALGLQGQDAALTQATARDFVAAAAQSRRGSDLGAVVETFLTGLRREKPAVAAQLLELAGSMPTDEEHNTAFLWMAGPFNRFDAHLGTSRLALPTNKLNAIRDALREYNDRNNPWLYQVDKLVSEDEPSREGQGGRLALEELYGMIRWRLFRQFWHRLAKILTEQEMRKLFDWARGFVREKDAHLLVAPRS